MYSIITEREITRTAEQKKINSGRRRGKAEIMKKTIDLVNEVMELGFSREEALEGIDASLDNEVGFENRKPLMEEEISEELYESILEGFREEAEA